MSEHEGELTERVDALAAWIKELDSQLHASTAIGDSKALKELAKALEAWNKHDPKLEKRLTERVDVLADRFATLAGTVNTSAASLAGKDGEIAALRRELEEGNTRIESIVRELRQSGSGTDVADLRRAVAELSSARERRTDDSRVQAISGELDVLAQRLDTLSKTVSTTAAGLAGRDGELITLRARVDETESRAGSLVDDLRRSLEDVSRQVDALGEGSGDAKLAQRFEGYIGDLARQIQAIAGDLNTVSASVTDATETIGATEEQVAALAESFEEAGERIDAMILELQQTVAALPTGGAIDDEVVERLDDLGARIDAMTGHVAELEASMTVQWRETAGSAAAVDHLLAELSSRLGELERDRDATVAEVARATESWVDERAWVRGQLDELAAEIDGNRIDETLAPRLHELAARVEVIEQGQALVGAEISRVAQSWEAERDALRSELDAAIDGNRIDETLAPRLHDLAARVEVIEQGHTVVGEEISLVAQSWEAERDALRSELAAEIDGNRIDETLAPRLHELAARVEVIEQDQTVIGADISRVAETWEAERHDLRSELDALSTTVGSLPVSAASTSAESPHETEALLLELSHRLDSMEHERAAVAAEISRAQELWNAEFGSLGARLDEVALATSSAPSVEDTGAIHRIDELAERLGAMERESLERQSDAVAGSPSDSSAVADELRDLRVLMNGLRMRLSSSEKELEALSSRGDVVSRLDEIGLRLGALERSASTFVPVPVARPGDGRFRVELRGLEQKMQQLESSAQENRDAVLTQFERLASRLQWRLQQLELESADAGYSTKATPAPLGQVVPIRGEG